MKNPEMLKFIPDYHKTKKTCKYLVKKLPDLLKYVPDQYQTQQMCDKAVLENGGTLKSVPGSYKNHKICDKVVDNYPHAFEFPKCYKTCVMILILL